MSKARKRFFYNGILMSVVGLAIRSIAMLFNSYITRAVGAEGVGLFTLIMTVYSFAITFATSGISLTVTRLVATAIGAGNSRGVGRIMRNSVVYALAFSLFSAIILAIGADWFSLRIIGDGRAALPLRILGASLVPISLGSVFSGYFVGVKSIGRSAAVGIASQGLKILITVFFVLRYAHLGVEYAILALAAATSLTELSTFLVALFQFLADRRRAHGEGDGSAGFSDVCNMAIPLALSAYIRSALLTLEHILIPKRLRDRGDSLADSLSAYGMLHGMALPIIVFPMAPLSSFSGLLVPEFAEDMARSDNIRMQRVASEALNATLSYSVAIAVFIFFFSEEIGYAVYQSYGAGRYIALMAPVIPLMYLDHVSDSVLKGIGEHVYSMWVNIFDSLISVCLVWVLIPFMGISGYAVVIIVMEGFNFSLSALRLYSRINFRICFAKSFIVPLISSAAAAFFCRALFAPSGASACGHLLVSKIVFSVSVFLAVYILANRMFFPKKA